MGLLQGHENERQAACAVETANCLADHRAKRTLASDARIACPA
jgi:hypothetical protein